VGVCRGWRSGFVISSFFSLLGNLASTGASVHTPPRLLCSITVASVPLSHRALSRPGVLLMQLSRARPALQVLSGPLSLVNVPSMCCNPVTESSSTQSEYSYSYASENTESSTSGESCPERPLFL
jgi:hypothetical protein